MTDVFEEVEESLRQDKASELWKKYAPYAVGAAVALILAVAGYQGWKALQAQKVETDAKAYAKVMDDLQKKDLAGAKAGLETLSKGGGGFAAMSDHVLASVDKELTNDPAIAAKHLQDAANRKAGLMSDMATLKLAYLKADTATMAELEAIVAPLQKKGGQFGALSRELVAAKALSTGDVERAKRDYQALAIDIDAPEEMKRRVSQALVVISSSKPETPAPAAAAPSAAAQAAPAESGKKPQ